MRKPTFLILRKKHILSALALILLMASMVFLLKHEQVKSVANTPGERIIHMVTGEFKTTLKDGQEMEA